MYFVIGLGNYGREYENTRHNFAWILFDEHLGKDVWEKDSFLLSLVAEASIEEENVLFLKPLTYMNLSGKVIPLLKKKYPEQFSPERLIVVHDELDLPFGEVRAVFNRGDAGHNGVRSITQHLGTKAFWRIRLGIAQEREGRVIKPNVLSPFHEDELRVIKTEILKKYEKALKDILVK